MYGLRVANRYAKALLEYTLQQNSLEGVFADMTLIDKTSTFVPIRYPKTIITTPKTVITIYKVLTCLKNSVNFFSFQ